MPLTLCRLEPDTEICILELAMRGFGQISDLCRVARPEWELGPRNLRRSFAHLAIWMLAIGNAWVAVAPQIRRAGLHVIFLGCFTALLLAALFPRPGEQPAFPLRKLAWAGGLIALSLIGRVMVELDPTSFHLWMGVSAASFLAATVACVRVPVGTRTQSV